MMEVLESARSAVVKVGTARRFVIEGYEDNRLVITAAHCLTRPVQIRREIDEENEHAVLSPAIAAMYLSERLYPNLLGSLNGEPKICVSAFSSIPSPIFPCWANPTARNYQSRQRRTKS